MSNFEAGKVYFIIKSLNVRGEMVESDKIGFFDNNRKLIEFSSGREFSSLSHSFSYYYYTLTPFVVPYPPADGNLPLADFMKAFVEEHDAKK